MRADCSVSQNAAAAAVQLALSADDSSLSTAAEHATTQTSLDYQQTHISTLHTCITVTCEARLH